MPVAAAIGGQWGDEGKGKIIDHLADGFDIIVRCQGGHNAGHTVKIERKEYPFHLVPSGILRPGKICIIGNGVVLDPPTLLEEIERLEEKGIDVPSRLFISDRAHIVFPHHSRIDSAREERRGKKKIGTTSRGIGPAYEDKASRSGLRTCEILDQAHLEERLKEITEEKNNYLRRIFGIEGYQREEVASMLIKFRDKVGRCITNTSALLNEKIEEGASVLLEGAQGTLLDIDHGTYPYVTSSNSSIGGAVSGAGISPFLLDDILIVLKAYCTRVGGGPFPTEQDNPTGDKIRERGREYGTTTGRPRRCGWFDAVAARYAVGINGPTGVALTLLDVLDDFDELKICTGYKYEGKEIERFPAEPWILEKCEARYESFEGWKTDLSGITKMEDLPERAVKFIRRIEEFIGCKLSVISVGPERSQIMFDHKSELATLLF